MQIVVLDQHPLADSRINRHIRYMSKRDYSVFRVNINRSLPYDHSSLTADTTIPCYIVGDGYTKNRTLNKICYNFDRFFLNHEDIEAIMTQLGVSYEIPTIIHVHDPILLPFAVKTSSHFRKVRVVYDRHEVYEAATKYFSMISLPAIGRFCEVLTSDKIDGVVTVLADYRSDIERMFPHSKIGVVPNFPAFEDYDESAIHSKIMSVSTASVLQFIYVGSLNWNRDRDIGLILYLAEYLLSQNYNVKFLIGGSTSDEKLLSEFSRMSHLYPGKFMYAGYLSREKVIQYTQESHFGFLLIKPDTDYWVLTSPNKVFEYLRCGVIPILRAKCSYKEQLQDCSLWFERDDSKEHILEEIKSLLHDPDKVHELMLRSYHISSRYSYDTAASEYVSLYDALDVDSKDIQG